VRLNDFPETELYALIADGEEITSFDDWPDSWNRPGASETTLNSQDESKMLSLTLREREILRLLAQELSTKQIAMDLNISVTTVKAHMAHILSILDRLQNLGRISLIPHEEQQRRSRN